MSKLDATKEKLLTLKDGEQYRIHQMELMDAIAEDRRLWQFNPPDDDALILDMRPMTLGYWCARHGLVVEQNPASDYVTFVRVTP